VVMDWGPSETHPSHIGLDIPVGLATKLIRQRQLYQLSSVPPESSTLRMHVLMSTSIPLCKAVAKEKGLP